MQREVIDIPEATREAWQWSVDILADLIGVPAALIVRVCDAKQTEVLLASRTDANAYLKGDFNERYPESYFEASLVESRPVKVVNAATEARWRNSPGRCRGMVSYLGLPLTWPDGEAFGVICVMDQQANRYSFRSERLIEQFQEAVNLHLAVLFQARELDERARIDAISGACTRRDFFESGNVEVKRARRYGIALSVMLLDLDHFKDINDRHGHACGDAVLRALTRRVMKSLRSSDKYCRFDGDEFVLLLPHSELPGARMLAERMRLLVEREAVAVGDLEIPVTVSIGLACLEGAGETLDEMLAKAHKALRVAKANGRNRIETHERLAGLHD
ncbi:MAG: GGDEF domain-containing protein [Gammaproteobacteria bacterium]|nr:GGDEF domain-containing protein [Gammaproteobacteria bacterium]